MSRRPRSRDPQKSKTGEFSGLPKSPESQTSRSPILALQQDSGNHAVHDLLQQDRRTSAPTWIIDSPHSQKEKEAEAFADEAIKQPFPGDERAPQSPKTTPKPGIDFQGGEPLPFTLRSTLESSAPPNQTLEDVRIHRDDRAAQAAQGLNAEAFTIGRDVFFGHQQFQPGTQKGKHLIAHELAHVMQQGTTSDSQSAASGSAVLVQRKAISEEFDTSALGAMGPGHDEETSTGATQEAEPSKNTEPPKNKEDLAAEAEVKPEDAAKAITANADSIDPALLEQKEDLKKRIAGIAQKKGQKLMPSDKAIRKRLQQIEPSLLDLLPKNKVRGARTIEKNKSGGGKLNLRVVQIESHGGVNSNRTGVRTITDPQASVEMIHIQFVSKLTQDNEDIAQALLKAGPVGKDGKFTDKQIEKALKDFLVDLQSTPLAHELVHAQILAERLGWMSGKKVPQAVQDFKSVLNFALTDPQLKPARDAVVKEVRSVAPGSDPDHELEFFVQEKFVGQRIDQDIFGLNASNTRVAEAYAQIWLKPHFDEDFSEEILKFKTRDLASAVESFYNQIDALHAAKTTPANIQIEEPKGDGL